MSDTSLLESILRGAGQGATAGFSDEGVSRILAALPGPNDPEGYDREYAAGSRQADYQQTERAANASAAKDHPIAYGTGSVIGALPSTLAVPAGVGGSAAARIAATGLTGGAMGGLAGAGHADGNDVAQSVGRGAALGAGLGTAGGAVLEAAPYVRQALSQVGRAAEPELAGAGAGINQSAAGGMLPPRPTTGDMPREVFIPKAPKNIVPEEAIGAADDLADASMVANSAKANTGKVSDSQLGAYKQASKKFDEATGVRAKPPAKPSSDSKATVPPKRGARAQAADPSNRPTVRAPEPTFSVRPGELPTRPAPPPNLPPSMRPTARPDAAAPTMPAPPPALGRPTVPAPAMPTVPAPPQMPPSMRPTMLDMSPIRPTLNPGSEQAYKDAVLREIAESARRSSM